MARQKSVSVIVMVDESHKDSLGELASNLKAKGFVLNETLGAIGVLSGSVPVDSLAELSTVPGVLGVEEERNDYRTHH